MRRLRRDPDKVTLAEAIAWVRSYRWDGCICPCCGQVAKVYPRKLNSGMARSLINMWRNAGLRWQDITLLPARHREEGKLRYWELVEPQEDMRGWWRVTPAGERFIKNSLLVPSHALVYNGSLIRLEGDLITIKDALGSRFDYDELMTTEVTP